MKRIILSIALVLGTIGASAQLMYKISGNGLEKPSYVVGTHRLAPAAMAQLINGIGDALNGTDQMYGELNVDVATADASQTVKEASTLAGGKTIQQLLSADELKRFNGFLMKTQEQDLRNRMLAAKIEKKTPAALLHEMKIWLYLSNHRGTFDPMSQIDAYFVQLAKKNNMPMFGMETIEEYANVVYKAASEKRQKEQMMCLVDNQSFYQRAGPERENRRQLRRYGRGGECLSGAHCTMGAEDARHHEGSPHPLRLRHRETAWQQGNPATAPRCRLYR